MLIEVSDAERLYGDSLLLAERATAAGVSLSLNVSAGLPHVWPWFWPRLALADEALSRIGTFLQKEFR